MHCRFNRIQVFFCLDCAVKPPQNILKYFFKRRARCGALSTVLLAKNPPAYEAPMLFFYTMSTKRIDFIYTELVPFTHEQAPRQRSIDGMQSNGSLWLWCNI